MCSDISQEQRFAWFLERHSAEFTKIEATTGPVINLPIIRHVSPTADSHAGSVTVEMGGSTAACSITLQLVEEGNNSLVISVDCGPLAANKSLARQALNILNRIQLQFEEPSVEEGWLLQYSVSVFLLAPGTANIPALAMAYYECFKAATRPLDLYAEQSKRVSVLSPYTSFVFASCMAYVTSGTKNVLIRNPTTLQFDISTGTMSVVMQGDDICFMDTHNVSYDIIKQLLQLLKY